MPDITIFYYAPLSLKKQSPPMNQKRFYAEVASKSRRIFEEEANVKLFKASLAALAAAALISFSPAVKAAGVDELPKDIQDKLYNKEFMDPAQPLGASAYRDFKAKKGPPWKIGYASSYAGNTWRAGVMDR